MLLAKDVKKRSRLRYVLLSLAVALGYSTAHAADADQSNTVSAGKYLATAADCIACHTANGGKPYAGGYAISSPMGTIYSTNITPSKTAGIGNYTEEQFAKAVREGVTPDGTHLYPAMPYTAYAKMTDQDIASLYDYFMKEVKPVDEVPQQTKLNFPFNIRASMIGWNMLYHDNTRFTPDASKSDEINRGNYLANALEHCATCHTPRNAMMAEDNSKFLGGGSLGSWYAPNITSDKVSGIGNWTQDELVTYLKTGHLAGKAQAAGPMAEAIEHSLQHLSDSDLKALSAYILQVPPVASTEKQARDTYGKPSTTEETSRGNEVKDADAGWRVFSSTCAACHQANGQGTHVYPSLFNNSVTGADRPDNLISAVLYGVHRTANGTTAYMPAFGPSAYYTDRLSDQQIADVSNYVLTNYGNPSVKVTVDDVKTIREGGKPSALVQFALPGIIVIAIIIIALIVVGLRRRQRKGV